MGGVPGHALITLAASPDTDFSRLRGIYAGLRKAARRFDISIVGGETVRSPGPLFLNIALTGRVERPRCVLRSGGRPGDALYVTGRLGGSLAGHHLDFIPRLVEARWLTAHFKLHAMMDLSDGLASDLPRLATASRCAFTLDETRIPKTKGSTLHQALTDGEDFELLFALPAKQTAALESAWKKQFPRLPLTRIGRLRASQPSTLNSQPPHGFDHFA
jgi:thiamine-monophosphate kinase